MLKQLIVAYTNSDYPAHPLDGKEHSYIELGVWLGNQRIALMMIGLGATLGMWNLLTPKTLMGNFIDDNTAAQMAGQGFISLQV